MYALFHKIQRKTKDESPFAIGSPALIWQIIFFYLPLILMMLSSVFILSDEEGLEGITFQNFSPLFSKTHLSIIFSSITLALSTAFFSLLIAYPLAHFIAFKGGRYKTFMLFFLIVPFWTNFLLHVYAWFFVLEREGFFNTLLKSLGLIQEPIHFLNSLFAVKSDATPYPSSCSCRFLPCIYSCLWRVYYSRTDGRRQKILCRECGLTICPWR